MDWSSAVPLWQRQSAGESRWARTEAVGEGRATSPTSLQPLVPLMTQIPITRTTSRHPITLSCLFTIVSTLKLKFSVLHSAVSGYTGP